MRGLVHAEQLYENRSTGKGLFDLERRAAQQADAMICVSNAMADYAATTFDNYRDAITVIPCCVETSGPDPRVQRDLIREQLGLRGKFVVAYCGGLQRWQLPLESAKLFKRIRWMQPSTYLLALTSDPIKMRNILSDAGVPQDQATVLNVPHSGVSHYLAAADLGLLLRERHLINAVASPVKFGEFMASSVPVIISDGVGDFSDLVRTEGLGIVLGNLNDLSQLTGWFDRWPIEQYGIRARCRELACIRLSLDWQMVELLKLYDQLVQDVRA
jgi:glycosyltransferase involved in cell wall biosynthesis